MRCSHAVVLVTATYYWWPSILPGSWGFLSHWLPLPYDKISATLACNFRLHADTSEKVKFYCELQLFMVKFILLHLDVYILQIEVQFEINAP